VRLGKLQESFTNPDTNFIRLYQTEDLKKCKSLNEVKETIQRVFTEADNYAANNCLKYTYFQLAKRPLWEQHEIEITPQHFILKGFDAYINVDLTESIEKVTPFIIVRNSNVSSLEDGQRIEITEDFIKSLNPLQQEIFLEALGRVEHETVEKLQNVWNLEQQRIDKWIKTCKVVL